ncbi:MAG: PAS domain-containing sensor histidine kinase [Rhizobiales bacterium]|nr:PAS domain-containing sensor histidine kinase [Hyphomicrobiales bacterium]
MAQKNERITSKLRRLTGWAGFGLVVLGIVSGLSTFAVLTGLTPIIPTKEVTTTLLLLNTGLVILMAAMIGSQVLFLLKERRKGTAGAGLHIRLISLFSLIAVVPAIIVAVFAFVTLSRGLDTWFSERTQAIVNSAVTVAEEYIKNTAEATRADVANISADLNQQKTLFDSDRPAFVRRVARHAALRGLAGAFVFDQSQKRIDVNVTASDKVKFLAPSPEMIGHADKGELVLIPPGEGGNLVRALIKLQSFPTHYFYVYRFISPTVIEQLTKTREAKAEYDRLLNQRTGVQLTFGMMYALVAFVFLLAAMWIGLWFSDRLVAPIVRILDASRRVAQGDFAAKVSTIEGIGDLETLARTFNFMTDQVAQHQDQLLKTNDQLDERRRFTEAMLAGVSAGVIGIDAEEKISLANRSALQLLGAPEGSLLSQPFSTALPEFASLFEQAKSRPSGFAEGQVEMQIRGRDLSFVARITTESSNDAQHGFVLTFDDITDLVSAQRNSAWADIARRIAHEIKNPLTPIQLSAERLKRKYSKQIHSDRQVFEQCTDTIIRQVGDIGRMVDEFSSFARMPKAAPEPMNLAEVIRDATVLQRVSTSDIDIDVDVSKADFVFLFDRRLITQAVTNLVKNASEAIDGRPLAENLEKGHVQVEAGIEHDVPFIRVTDNGVGLPKENRNRLAEPYMTTREKGTGLGLAIVKRIMEEHGGRLRLQDAPNGKGAQVTLEFSRLPEPLLISAE